MLMSTLSDDSDVLWLISSDNFPFRSLISESHVCYVFTALQLRQHSAVPLLSGVETDCSECTKKLSQSDEISILEVY